MNKLRLGFLASHNGTDMRGIVKACEDGQLEAIPVVVISNNPLSPALEFARARKISCFCINSKTAGTSAMRDIKMRDILLSYNVDLVILSGYMRKIEEKTLEAFPEKILNVHPSLLPKYAGLYGDSVHKAVLDAHEKISGLTIHTIDKEYDKGTILLQSEVKVFSTDTIVSLKERIQKEEIKSFISLLKNYKTIKKT